MQREESDQLQTCADCGASVRSSQGIYGFGTEGVLCFDGAERRGGSQDAMHDRWTDSPSVGDLVSSEA